MTWEKTRYFLLKIVTCSLLILQSRRKEQRAPSQVRRQQSLALEPLSAALALEVALLVRALVRLERRQGGEHAAAGLALDLVLGRHVRLELPARVEGAVTAVAPQVLCRKGY